MSHEKTGRVEIERATDEESGKRATQFDADGEPTRAPREALLPKVKQALSAIAEVAHV